MIVPLPEFFIRKNLPATPTAVGRVIVNVPDVASIKWSNSVSTVYVPDTATYVNVIPPSEIRPLRVINSFAI